MRPLDELLHDLDALGVVVTSNGQRLRVRGPSGAVTTELRTEIAGRKAELLCRLARSPAEPASAPRGAEAPLSAYQRPIWLAEQLAGTSSAFHMQAGWRIEGRLDREALHWAIGEVLARHDVLRIRIRPDDGEPMQRPEPLAPFSFADEAPVSDDAESIRTAAAEEARRPFDMTADPPFRARLIPLGREASLLLLTLHHLVADAWSMGVLMRELTALYAARLDGAASSPLPPPAMQYADFARWQRETLAGGLLDARLAYWRETLAGATTDLDLRTDRRRSVRAARRSAMETFALEPGLVAALRATGRRCGVTPFMTLLAAYAVLLARWSRQPELTIGCPYGDRELAETHDLIGLFVSTLVLRVRPAAAATFADLLGKVRETCLGAFSHVVPLDRLVAAVPAERSRHGAPLFQAMFVLQTAELAGLALRDAHVEPLATTAPAIECDLNLSLRPEGGAIAGFLEYDADLFDPPTAGRLVRSYRTILEGIAADATPSLSQIRWAPEPESALALGVWNRAAARDEAAAPVHQRIAARAACEPDRPAVEGEGEGRSYRELDHRANRLAHLLVGLGVGPEGVVGLALDRSPALVVAMLAVLKAGAAYAVLDQSQPAPRLQGLIAAGRLGLIVDDGHALRLPPGVRRVSLRDDAAAIAAQPPFAPAPAIGPASLASVCFTSGSTGTPKGVMVEHRSLANHAAAVVLEYDLTPGDRVLQFAAPGFDVVAEEVFPTLAAGATLVLRPGGIDESLATFHEFVTARRITVLNLPAAFWHAWVAWLLEERRRPPALLRLLVVGSDRVARERLVQWRRLAPGVGWLNAYGPTEATVTATVHRAPEGDGGGTSHAVPIGRPLANIRTYVLDEQARPVPIGVVGEIVIGGAGVARGYRDQPAPTAASFVADPFDPRPGARMYRTGDLGRFLPDGVLEFLDRADQQFKVRGFRVEPGEIEACLDACPGVRQSAVILRPGDAGQARIVAFVERRDDSVTEARAREWVLGRLPAYMVPSAVSFLERLPLNPAGKIDRRALAQIDPAVPASSVAAPGRTPAEETLAAIWGEVLGVMRVGRDDNFFDLGGDSILALQVVARARRHGLVLTTRQIFVGQTVAAVAGRATVAEDPRPWEDAVVGPARLTPIQAWFFEHVATDRHHYNQAVLLAVPDRIDPAALRVALDALLVHHDALRCRFDADGRARCSAPGESAALDTVRLHGTPDARRRQREAAISAAHTGLDLAHGPLLRAVLFDSDEPSQGRLLLVIHHLVVDVVSWGILRDDLATAYRQAADGLPILLPVKTTSYRDWAEQLHALVPGIDGAFLEGLSAGDDDLFAPDVGPADAGAEPLLLHAELDEGWTRRLTRLLPTQSGARPEEVLLAALQRAVLAVSGRRSVRVDLERHGRTAARGLGDVSRTVGWFTNVVPLLLRLRGEDASQDPLADVQAQARCAPDDGIGFGILRYMAADVEVRERVRGIPDAPFLVNYLGHAAAPRDGDGPFAVCDEPSGPSQSPKISRSHPFELNAMVVGGRLRIAWSVAAGVGPEAAERFGAAFLVALTDLLERDSEAPDGPSPAIVAVSDRLGLDGEALDRLVEFLGTTGEAIEEIVPLSPLQEGILFESLLGGAETYFDQLRLTVRGPVDTAALRDAFGQAVRRHAALRSCVVRLGSDRPHQVVFRSAGLPWTEEDWRGIEARQHEPLIAYRLRGDRAGGFDLATAPLMRLILIRTADDRYELIWDVHHIVIDGWSTSIVLREVAAVYAKRTGGGTVDCGPAAPSFGEYNRWLRGQDHAAALDYWRGQLRDFTEPTPLAVDTLGVGGPSAVVSYREVAAGAGETASLLEFAAAHRLTLNTLVQGAWAILLRRYSGRDDVVFGVTVSVRPPEILRAEEIVGVLINTVPARVRVEDRERLVPWLRRLQDAQLDAGPFSHVSLAEVQRASDVRAGTPLFRSLLLFQNYPMPRTLAPLDLERVVVHERTNYPVTVVAFRDHALRLQVHYDDARLDSATVDRMLGHLRTLLLAMAEDPDRPLGALPMIGGDELGKLLEWSQGATTPLRHARLLDAIDARKAARPDATAVIAGDHALSYAELDGASNRLARWLRAHGVGPGTAVATCLPRTAESVVAILAVWKAGGIYVPIDPAYPVDRLAVMIEESRASVVVTDTTLADALPACAVLTICLDADASGIRAQDDGPCEAEVDGDGVAYLIFTSGSTGRPKGIANTHRGLASLSENQVAIFGLGASDRVLQFASPGFDASIWEMAMALGAGAALCVAASEEIRPGAPLLQLLRERRVTIVTLPPTALAALPRESLPDLHTIVVAGEACPADLAEQWRAGRRFFNAYGPTEASVCATIAEIHAPAACLPIGRPLDRVRCHVLDGAMRPVPVGVAGDLYLGGAGLARGYLTPGATAAGFVADPFGAAGRLYRTGDRARYLPSGDLEFLGRTDHQVKVRGFRIELGEIDTVLTRHPGILEAAVLACDDGDGGARIEAWFSSDDPPSLEALREFLGRTLPEHMIPARFHPLEALPLTPSGKVDRKALLLRRAAPLRPAAATVPAYDAIEATIVRIWEEALGIGEVGVHDNFFDLGGDSLLAIQVVTRANQAGVPITLHQIMDADSQTVATLAAAVRQPSPTDPPRTATDQAAQAGAVPLTPIQHWFFELGSPEPHHYNQGLLLQVGEAIDADRLAGAARALLAHHDALRLRFDRGTDGWTQRYAPPGDDECFTQVDLSELGEHDARDVIEAIAADRQRSFRLDSGPLLRLTHFVLAPPSPSRLLVVVHHLAVDGVSWPILLEDLFALIAGGDRLPAKTSSFRRWAERLIAFANSAESQDERAYWLDPARTRAAHAGDVFVGCIPGTVGDASRLTTLLPAAETAVLLRESSRSLGGTFEELTITALALALRDVTGRGSTAIDLEWHGRDPRFEDVDLSRTVGWFASIAPVLLELPPGSDLPAAIAAVREQLRAQADHGIGFGALRYLSADAAIREAVAELPRPQIAFNYLGRWDQVWPRGIDLRPAPESAGPSFSPAMLRPHVLGVDALIIDGRLQIDWTFPPALGDVVSRLSRSFQDFMGRFADRSQPVRAAASRSAEAVGTAGLEGLDDYIAREMDRWRMPGLALAVARGGSILHSRGYGVRGTEGDGPVTPQTLFGTGSVAKAFTATLLAALRSEGKLQWDRPIRAYLPELEMDEPVATEGLSARDLLTHRAGLPDHGFLLRYSGLTRREVFRRLRHLTPSAPFRTGFQSSNLAYTIAGLLAEQLAGVDWDEAIRGRIFAPLGMAHAASSAAELLRRGDIARPFRRTADGDLVLMPLIEAAAAAPATSIYCGAEDLLKFASLHLDEGRAGGRALLAAVDAAEMLRPQVAAPNFPLSPGPGLDPEFGPLHAGLGFWLCTFRGRRIVFQAGHTDGFTSLVALLPGRGIAAAALGNLHACPLPACIVYHVFDRLLGLEHVDWSGRTMERSAAGRPLPASAPDGAGRLVPADRRTQYAGTYRHPGFGAVVVEPDGERLLLSYQQLKIELRWSHAGRCEGADDEANPLRKIRVQFDGGDGEECVALRMPLEPALPEITFARTTCPS
jgi:amino acid adenylation domain-containing protein/non-ribosomal peptide synthase protein (TIGR01720 family)